MSVAARLLRDARQRARLTQTELARRARTSQSAVSAYESGSKDPTVETLAKLLRAAGAVLSGGPAPADVRAFLREQGAAPGGETLATAARRIVSGQDSWFVLREFLDGVGLTASVQGAEAVGGLLHGPAHTGQERLDALLGALAEHLAELHGLERPAWCVEPDRFLDTWWFPHTRRAFDAIALRDAPAAFRRRGIFLHPSMLERV